jgi:8-oxo-dGTP pyrophosphatase MutT (NUDIX family)
MSYKLVGKKKPTYSASIHKALIIDGRIHSYYHGPEHTQVQPWHPSVTKKHPDAFSKINDGRAIAAQSTPHETKFQGALHQDNLKHAQKYINKHHKGSDKIVWAHSSDNWNKPSHTFSYKDFMSATDPSKICKHSISIPTTKSVVKKYFKESTSMLERQTQSFFDTPHMKNVKGTCKRCGKSFSKDVPRQVNSVPNKEFCSDCFTHRHEPTYSREAEGAEETTSHIRDVYKAADTHPTYQSYTMASLVQAESSLSESSDIESAFLLAGDAIRSSIEENTDVASCYVQCGQVSPGNAPRLDVFMEWCIDDRPSDQYGCTYVFVESGKVRISDCDENSCYHISLSDTSISDKEVAESIYDHMSVFYDPSSIRTWKTTTVAENLHKLLKYGKDAPATSYAQILSCLKSALGEKARIVPHQIDLVLAESPATLYSYYFQWNSTVPESYGQEYKGPGELIIDPSSRSASTSPQAPAQFEAVDYSIPFRTPIIQIDIDEGTVNIVEKDEIVKSIGKEDTDEDVTATLLTKAHQDESEYSGKIIEQDSFVEKITPGLFNAYSKVSADKAWHTCAECNAVIPHYVGRYSKHCARCGCDMSGQDGFPGNKTLKPILNDAPPIQDVKEGYTPLSTRVNLIEWIENICKSVHASNYYPMIPWSPNHRVLCLESTDGVTATFNAYFPVEEAYNISPSKFILPLSSISTTQTLKQLSSLLHSFIREHGGTPIYPHTLSESDDADKSGWITKHGEFLHIGNDTHPGSLIKNPHIHQKLGVKYLQKDAFGEIFKGGHVRVRYPSQGYAGDIASFEGHLTPDTLKLSQSYIQKHAPGAKNVWWDDKSTFPGSHHDMPVHKFMRATHPSHVHSDSMVAKYHEGIGVNSPTTPLDAPATASLPVGDEVKAEVMGMPISTEFGAQSGTATGTPGEDSSSNIQQQDKGIPPENLGCIYRGSQKGEMAGSSSGPGSDPPPGDGSPLAAKNSPFPAPSVGDAEGDKEKDDTKDLEQTVDDFGLSIPRQRYEDTQYESAGWVNTKGEHLEIGKEGHAHSVKNPDVAKHLGFGGEDIHDGNYGHYYGKALQTGNLRVRQGGVDFSPLTAGIHGHLNPESLKRAQHYVAHHAPSAKSVIWDEHSRTGRTIKNSHMVDRSRFLSAIHPDDIKAPAARSQSLVGAYHEGEVQESKAGWVTKQGEFVDISGDPADQAYHYGSLSNPDIQKKLGVHGDVDFKDPKTSKLPALHKVFNNGHLRVRVHSGVSTSFEGHLTPDSIKVAQGFITKHAPATQRVFWDHAYTSGHPQGGESIVTSHKKFMGASHPDHLTKKQPAKSLVAQWREESTVDESLPSVMHHSADSHARWVRYHRMVTSAPKEYRDAAVRAHSSSHAAITHGDMHDIAAMHHVRASEIATDLSHSNPSMQSHWSSVADIHRWYADQHKNTKSCVSCAEVTKPADESKVDSHELEVGIGEEYEHTNDKSVAKKIALQHLAEDPKYYSKLKKAGLVKKDEAQASEDVLATKNRYLHTPVDKKTGKPILMDDPDEMMGDMAVRGVGEAEESAVLQNRKGHDFLRMIWDPDRQSAEIIHHKSNDRIGYVASMNNTWHHSSDSTGPWFPVSPSNPEQAARALAISQHLKESIEIEEEVLQQKHTDDGPAFRTYLLRDFGISVDMIKNIAFDDQFTRTVTLKGGKKLSFKFSTDRWLCIVDKKTYDTTTIDGRSRIKLIAGRAVPRSSVSESMGNEYRDGWLSKEGKYIGIGSKKTHLGSLSDPVIRKSLNISDKGSTLYSAFDKGHIRLSHNTTSGELSVEGYLDHNSLSRVQNHYSGDGGIKHVHWTDSKSKHTHSVPHYEFFSATSPDHIKPKKQSMSLAGQYHESDGPGYAKGGKQYKSVVCIILKGNKEVLLGRSTADDDRKGTLAFPGGHIDPEDGDDLNAAAEREGFEETGCKIRATGNAFDHKDKPDIAFMICDYLSGSVHPNQEFTTMEWYPLSTVRDLDDLYPPNRTAIERLYGEAGIKLEALPSVPSVTTSDYWKDRQFFHKKQVGPDGSPLLYKVTKIDHTKNRVHYKPLPKYKNWGYTSSSKPSYFLNNDLLRWESSNVDEVADPQGPYHLSAFLSQHGKKGRWAINKVISATKKYPELQNHVDDWPQILNVASKIIAGKDYTESIGEASAARISTVSPDRGAPPRTAPGNSAKKIGDDPSQGGLRTIPMIDPQQVGNNLHKPGTDGTSQSAAMVQQMSGGMQPQQQQGQPMQQMPTTIRLRFDNPEDFNKAVGWFKAVNVPFEAGNNELLFLASDPVTSELISRTATAFGLSITSV